ncbi:MAG TPA: J domain-containing protein [Acidimicrobiia bacterium]|nr:J domain-containing protein [Acidimicrobiia bacterium]
MPLYYDLLGVGAEADAGEIHRAYLRQAQSLHPDRFVGAPEPERRRAEAEMKALNEAWNTLKNPDARARYDAEQDADAGADSAWHGEWNGVGDDDPSPPSRSPLRRTGVRLAVVAVVVAGLAGSGIAVFGRGPDPSPPPSRAGSWNPSAVAALRSAAIGAGLTPTAADCFVGAVTGRYRPSDDVDPAVIRQTLDSCR